jgi:hypothetical protein
MEKFFDRYMPEHYEYADPTEFDIGDYGWGIDYISSTFLDGWINYVKPIKVFAISRYTPSAKLEARVKEFYEEDHFHTKFHPLGDDVVLLCREEFRKHSNGQGLDNPHLEKGEEQGYWFFWYDCDVSDCSIGRFATRDTEAEVIASFERMMKERSEWFYEHPGQNQNGESGDGKLFELDVKKITGWVSLY